MLVESIESCSPVSPTAGTNRIRLAVAEEELAAVEVLPVVEELAAAVLVPSSSEASGAAGRTCTARVAGWPHV